MKLTINDNSLYLDYYNIYGRQSDFKNTIIIDDNFTLNQQLLEINNSISGKITEYLNSFLSNLITIEVPDIDTDIINLIGNISDILYGRPDIKKLIYYDSNGRLIQNTDIVRNIAFYKIKSITPAEEVFEETRNKYRIIKVDSFVLIVQFRNLRKVSMLHLYKIDYTVYIMPINYYNHTIGYNLGILNSYCNSSKMMRGMKEWAETKFKITDMTEDELCENLETIIIEKYIEPVVQVD